MTLEEKLEAMELLWKSISEKPNEVASPSWHEEIVAARLAKIDKGEAKFLSIEEARQKLRKSKPRGMCCFWLTLLAIYRQRGISTMLAKTVLANTAWSHCLRIAKNCTNCMASIECNFGCHRMLASRFPFGIYYRDSGLETQVIAILDLRRDPGWILHQVTRRLD